MAIPTDDPQTPTSVSHPEPAALAPADLVDSNHAANSVTYTEKDFLTN